MGLAARFFYVVDLSDGPLVTTLAIRNGRSRALYIVLVAKQGQRSNRTDGDFKHAFRFSAYLSVKCMWASCSEEGSSPDDDL